MIQPLVSEPTPVSGCDTDLPSLLAVALDEEVTLLEALRALFAAQREAVASGDPRALDDGVFAATRVMRTMEEARRRRRRLTERLLGADYEQDDLYAVLAEVPNRPARLALDRLGEAAAALRSEVAVLRRVLEATLTDNRRYLDVLLGGSGGDRQAPAGYAAQAPASGVVVDTVR